MAKPSNVGARFLSSQNALVNEIYVRALFEMKGWASDNTSLVHIDPSDVE
ncbi:uncharacterized protein FFNC_15572 [Fusarium fujikuroi]|nr:uncharacterized protein FFNC_15572 [Fusarium fujikuroi]